MNRREMVRASAVLLSSRLMGTNWLHGLHHSRTAQLTRQLQALLNAAEPGTTLSLPYALRTLEIDRPLLLEVPALTIDGGGAEIRQISPDASGLIVTAPGVTIRNLTLTGPGVTAVQGRAVGIEWTGKRSAYLTGPTLADSVVRRWTKAIEGRFCDQAVIRRCTISDVDYAAIIFESSRNSEVSGNLIERVLGRPNAYGIAITRGSGGLLEHPPSSSFRVFDNTISNVPYWEALDTHGGVDIQFYRNNIIDARIGIMMTVSDNLAPKRCRAYENTIRIGKASPQTGVEIVGIPSASAEDCTIENNLIDGFGTQGSDAGAAVRVQWATRPKIVSNTINNSKQSAIAVFGTVRDLDIRANFISGIDASAGPFIAAIKIPSGDVTGQIVENRIEAGIAAGIRTYAPQPLLVRGNEIETTGRKYHPDVSSFRVH